MLFNWLARANS